MTDITTTHESRMPCEDRGPGVRTAFTAPPASGAAIEAAAGVWWARLPLTSALGHVNVYLLEDDSGWTLVDTGVDGAACRAVLQDVLAQPPFCGRTPARVIATHFHPDHLGSAGRLAAEGAPLWTSRLTWLFGRVFQLDDREPPFDEHLLLAERAGLSGAALSAYRRRPPSDFHRTVDPLPATYVRVQDGDVLPIGSRKWTVLLGNGHAPEHLTLWSDDGLAITGDQILPGMTTNLSVHPSEPEADLVREWTESCERIIAFADDNTLCLPGHHLPFTGAVTRCRQLLASQEQALQRLTACLNRPRTAVECLPHVYGRDVQPHESPALIAEMMGFLNHLRQRGLVTRVLSGEQFLWRRTPAELVRQDTSFKPPRNPK